MYFEPLTPYIDCQLKLYPLQMILEEKEYPSLLRTDQLLKEDEEVYIVQVPKSFKSASLMNLDINLKNPGTVVVDKREYVPVVTKVDGVKTLLASKNQKMSTTGFEVKSIVRLTESVIVPSNPTIEVPPDHRVPHPENLVSRHPIYGRLNTSQEICKKASKRRKEEFEVKQEEDEVPKKKKKKKDKNNEEHNAHVVIEDSGVQTKKKKSKKSKE